MASLCDQVVFKLSNFGKPYLATSSGLNMISAHPRRMERLINSNGRIQRVRSALCASHNAYLDVPCWKAFDAG